MRRSYALSINFPLLVASLLFILSAEASSAAQRDPPTASATASMPPYCVDFSAEACARIKAVLDTKVKPDYCVPGFAIVGHLPKLTDEQLRICYAQPAPPVSAEQQRKWDEQDARTAAARKRRVEDARAMVREDWEKYRTPIESLEIGFRCELVDKVSGDYALQKLKVSMQGELIRAGLIGDSAMSIDNFVSNAIEAGKTQAVNGACERMSPADRGHFRAWVAALIR